MKNFVFIYMQICKGYFMFCKKIVLEISFKYVFCPGESLNLFVTCPEKSVDTGHGT